jgi:ribose transport system substrate-binding protein
MKFKRRIKQNVTIALVLTSLVIPFGISSVVAATKPKPAPLPITEFVGFQKVKPGSGKGLTLGYISLGDSVPFVKLVSDSIKAQAKIAGVKLEFCDSQLDSAKALACAQAFKVKKVQGYLNFQLDAGAGPAIYAAGPQVPVIAVDIVQSPKEIAFMGANNHRAGVVTGVGLGNLIKKKFACKYDAILSMESPGVGAVNEARIGGVKEGFASVCGPIGLAKLHTIDASFIAQGQASVQAAMTTLPDAHTIVVFAMNVDSVLGAFKAADQLGRSTDLYAAGQGADPTSWCQIVNNPNWAGDTAYFPEHYGEIGIPYLIAAVKKIQIPALLQVNHTWIDKSNIAKYYPKSASC